MFPEFRKRGNVLERERFGKRNPDLLTNRAWAGEFHVTGIASGARAPPLLRFFLTDLPNL